MVVRHEVALIYVFMAGSSIIDGWVVIPDRSCRVDKAGEYGYEIVKSGEPMNKT